MIKDTNNSLKNTIKQSSITLKDARQIPQSNHSMPQGKGVPDTIQRCGRYQILHVQTCHEIRLIYDIPNLKSENIHQQKT